MQDRPQQTYWPIIASQWGTKLSDATFRYNWTAAWKQAMKDKMMYVTQDHYDEDQQFLMRFSSHMILIINLKLPYFLTYKDFKFSLPFADTYGHGSKIIP